MTDHVAPVWRSDVPEAGRVGGGRVGGAQVGVDESGGVGGGAVPVGGADRGAAADGDEGPPAHGAAIAVGVLKGDVGGGVLG